MDAGTMAGIWSAIGALILWAIVALLLWQAFRRSPKSRSKRAQKSIRKNPTPQKLEEIATDFRLSTAVRQEAIAKMKRFEALARVLDQYQKQKKEVPIVVQRMLDLHIGADVFAVDFDLPAAVRQDAIALLDSPEALASVLDKYLKQGVDAQIVARRMVDLGGNAEGLAVDFELPLVLRQEAIARLEDVEFLALILDEYLKQDKEVLVVASKMLDLKAGDEYLPLFEQVFQWVIAKTKGFRDTEIVEFTIKLAARFPSIIRSNWGLIKTGVHADDSRGGAHDDSGDEYHVDKTTYYDFIKWRDGITTPVTSGRKKHDDYHSSPSDCAHSDHSDTYAHKDIADPGGYLLKFPPAAIPPEE